MYVYAQCGKLFNYHRRAIKKEKKLLDLLFVFEVVKTVKTAKKY